MSWDQRYASADYVYGTDPNEFLAETVRELNGGGRVLCLAEGEGRNAVFLARQGYDVRAVDASAVGLVGHAGSSVPDRFARSAGAALGKFEIGWLFRHLPALLRHFWLCSVGTELPAWPTS